MREQPGVFGGSKQNRKVWPRFRRIEGAGTGKTGYIGREKAFKTGRAAKCQAGA